MINQKVFIHKYGDVLILPVIVGIAAFFIPYAISPVDYWLSLMILLCGPGSGVPVILFPQKMLLFPESLFIIILSSLVLDVSAFATLNAIGILFLPALVKLIILSMTIVTTVIALIRRSYSRPIAAQPVQTKEWLSFFFGLVIVIVFFIAMKPIFK